LQRSQSDIQTVNGDGVVETRLKFCVRSIKYTSLFICRIRKGTIEENEEALNREWSGYRKGIRERERSVGEGSGDNERGEMERIW